MTRFAGWIVLVLGSAVSATAQTGVITVEEENFRSEPRGSILAELREGTRLDLGEARDQWREATLEAWIWAPSVQEQRAGELDVVVNAGGENLRASPNGDELGRALSGMRLERLERQGRWLRVRRTGWIWSASIRVEERVEERSEPPGETVPAVVGEPLADPDPATPVGSREFGTVTDGAPLLGAPAGDTVARFGAGAAVEVLAREGGWMRVRVEGWVPAGALGDPDSAAIVLADLPRDSLQASPGRFRGRLIEWTVQFIALQQAERFRSDFLEGEPFILARGPGDDPGFVYLAVPLERVAEVEGIQPLRWVRVLARVRNARSSLTDAPVLELLELEAAGR